MRLKLNAPEVMAVINVSPESFYSASVKSTEEELLKFAINVFKAGVRIFDIGGMSTAPFKRTWVPEDVELSRLKWAVNLLRGELGDRIIISVDTFRPRVASEVAKLGVDVLNDVTGLRYDKGLAKVAKEHGLAMILCAREATQSGLNPVEAIINEAKWSINVAESMGVNDIIIDPCIGFPPLDRDQNLEPNRQVPNTRYDDWPYRDIYLVANAARIRRELGKPICVGVSRKGFIRRLLGGGVEDSIWGTLGLHAYLAYVGVDVIRAHDAVETLNVVKIINMVKECGGDYLSCIDNVRKAYKEAD
ncbi:dihydropteroate synthase [Caldivirga maquilingensis]|uniref:Dihydropteroate synthase n=1 Tax=Caldivirga maquilingensis (strain ATCC 700844 / DSM 13496 / JCM 10307 / IC-167) TaxID=397948 RepID=A8MAA1_CALMQ|nr:dihydropteroate synthase [Caldivirga maquilingensis]ABW01033.1 dihydropteroate synthase [Caldivirga maquilingensis IC-167]